MYKKIQNDNDSNDSIESTEIIENTNSVKFDLGVLIGDLLANHLSGWLCRDKGVSVTPEEILDALNLPVNRKIIPSKNSTPMVVPSYFKGPGSKSGGKSGSRSKNNTQNDAKCTYTFTRGVSRGTQCGKVTAGPSIPGGEKFCKACLRKQAVKEHLSTGNDEMDTVLPPTLDNNTSISESNESEKGITLKVIRYTFKENHFYLPEQKFVIKPLSNHEHVVIGCDYDNDGTITPLTEEEEKIAINMSLCVQSTTNNIPQL